MAERKIRSNRALLNMVTINNSLHSWIQNFCLAALRLRYVVTIILFYLYLGTSLGSAAQFVYKNWKKQQKMKMIYRPNLMTALHITARNFIFWHHGIFITPYLKHAVLVYYRRIILENALTVVSQWREYTSGNEWAHH